MTATSSTEWSHCRCNYQLGLWTALMTCNIVVCHRNSCHWLWGLALSDTILLSLAVRACFVWYHSTVIGCEGLLCLKSFYQWPVMSASQIQAAMLCSLPTGMNILQISCHQVAGFPQVRQNKIPWLFQTNLKYFQAFWAFYNSNWKWWLHETSLLT